MPWFPYMALINTPLPQLDTKNYSFKASNSHPHFKLSASALSTSSWALPRQRSQHLHGAG